MNRRSAALAALVFLVALSPLTACGPASSAGVPTRPAVTSGGNPNEHEAHRDLTQSSVGNVREHLAHQSD